jgi:hypothetical protein
MGRHIAVCARAARFLWAPALFVCLLAVPSASRALNCTPASATITYAADDYLYFYLNGNLVLNGATFDPGAPPATVTIPIGDFSTPGSPNYIAFEDLNATPNQVSCTWLMTVSCADGSTSYFSPGDFSIAMYNDVAGTNPPPLYGGMSWYQSGWADTGNLFSGTPAWVTTSVWYAPLYDPGTGLSAPILSTNINATQSSNSEAIYYIGSSALSTPGPTPAATATFSPTITPTFTITPALSGPILCGGNLVTSWGSNGSGAGQFRSSQGIAVDASGNVYVTDSQNGDVQKFSNSGAFVLQWGTAAGPGQLNQPWAIAVDASGNVYVSDAGDRIMVYTSTGTFQYSFGSPGTGNGQFSEPEGIAVDNLGNIFVTDFILFGGTVERVQKFTTSGTYLTQWGSWGTGPGQFVEPKFVTVDPAGDVYVAESQGTRVQKFTNGGTFLLQWGSSGTGNGQFNDIVGLGSDPAGNIYVGNSGPGDIQEFTGTGVFDGIFPSYYGYTLAFDPLSGCIFSDQTLVYQVYKYGCGASGSPTYSPTQSATPTLSLTATLTSLVTATASPTTGPSATPTPTSLPSAPTVTLVQPNSGPLSGGNTVTLTGTNFTGVTAVTFGGVAGTSVVLLSATSLQVNAPAGSAGTVNVVVDNASGSSPVTAQNQYTYQAPPTISSVAPASGPNSGSTTVVITGTNFSNMLSVAFDGLAAAYVVNSPTQITVNLAPNHTGYGAKPVDVVVTNTGGSATLTGGYTYTPTLSSVSPNSGPVTGGNSVTLTGNGFLSATSVLINGVSAPFTVISDTQITVTNVPAVTTGSQVVGVSVVTAGGTASLANSYSYLPVVASVSPNSYSVLGGIATVITGNGFLNASAVTFGGNPATFVVVSDTEITVASVPPLGTGAKPVAVSVTGPGGTGSLANGFTYWPLFASINPDSGPVSGGNQVTLTGAGFSTTTSVLFGSNAAAYTIVSDTEIIVAHVPLNPGGAQSVTVTVDTPGGAAALDDGYTYQALPTLSSVSPTAGPAGGGNSVLITGTNFDTASAVLFGSNAALSFTVLSNTEISAVVPVGTGTVSVSVTNPIGTATLAAAYQYVSGGPTGGLTIDGGAAYTSSTAATLGLTCTAATPISTLQVRFSNDNVTWTAWEPYPLGNSAAWTLTPGRGTKTVYAQFMDGAGLVSAVVSASIDFENAPTISGILPAAGPVTGGNSVTISGTAFTTATSVQFGGVNAVSFQVVSDTEITAVAPAGTGIVDVTVANPIATATLAGEYQYADAPPTGNLAVLSLTGSATYTSITAVSLQLTCTAGTSLATVQARYSNDNITWTTWMPYPTATNTQAWTLNAGSGLKTVYVQYMDVAMLTSPVYSATITLAAPASLAATSASWPASLLVGQNLTVTLSVSNVGGVAAQIASAPVLTPSLAGSLSLQSGPAPSPPLAIAAGGEQTFTWVYKAAAKAVDSFAANISGTDVYLSALSAGSNPPGVTLLSGAVLAAQASCAPLSVTSGQSYQYQLLVTNTGDDEAVAVAAAMVLSDPNKAQILSGPVPPGPVSLSPTASMTFTWQLTAERSGSVQLKGTATGLDYLGGATLTAQASATQGIGFEGTTDSMILYPNPVGGDTLNVGLALTADATEVDVNVYNVAGQRLYKGSWADVAASEGGVVINGVLQWAPGVYLVKATAKLTDGTAQSFPVLKVMVKR